MRLEQALTQLEEIVNQMERGDLELDQALRLYEKGVRLCATCTQELEQAKGKLLILQQSAQGLSEQPFDPEGDKL